MSDTKNTFSQLTFPSHGARSLVWHGDQLVDWVAGGARFSLDGKYQRNPFCIGGVFDAAIQCGPYAVVYHRLGTKALLLRDGRIARELNRSYYHAEVYDYPVCLWRTRAGRHLLAHCPDEYNRIEIEDAETGQRLTASGARKPNDFFHSRLQVNPGATRLMSAGWAWHPVDVVTHVDLAPALEDASHLDRMDSYARDGKHYLDDESSAAWQSDQRIVMGGTLECDQPEPTWGEHGNSPHGLLVYDVSTRAVLSAVELAHTPGLLMPVGLDKVVTFHEHPRLVSLHDGSVLAAWPDLPTGEQESSISWHKEPPPPLALDVQHGRFAVARGQEIVVVTLGEAAQ